MIEKNLLDMVAVKNTRKRMKAITTSTSTKIRPEDEMILLMKTARNRFEKALQSGQIEIINEREWKLHPHRHISSFCSSPCSHTGNIKRSSPPMYGRSAFGI